VAALPIDRAEKTAQRSVLSEGAGVPVGHGREGANRNNRNRGRARSTRFRSSGPEAAGEQPQSISLDAAHDNTISRELVCEYALTPLGRGEEIERNSRNFG
jgi:hypothetical protein